MTQLALVIDLNVCVGCQACVTSCKEWNTSGISGFLSDHRPYDEDPTGTFFNRVQTNLMQRNFILLLAVLSFVPASAQTELEKLLEDRFDLESRGQGFARQFILKIRQHGIVQLPFSPPSEGDVCKDGPSLMWVFPPRCDGNFQMDSYHSKLMMEEKVMQSQT